ncbi:hypothetical protein EDB83DRAFT_2350581, partial [Lactarius deliciosus]
RVNPSSKTEKCQLCRISFRAQNLPAHVRKCERERRGRQGEIKYAKTRERRLRALEASHDDPPNLQSNTIQILDDRTQGPGDHGCKHKRPSPPKAEPWRPFFKTREDFLFSEVLMEVGMNKDRTERLIEVVRLCIEGKGSLTFSNYSDIRDAWERASLQLTAVSPHLAPHDGGPTGRGICSSGVTQS